MQQKIIDRMKKIQYALISQQPIQTPETIFTPQILDRMRTIAYKLTCQNLTNPPEPQKPIEKPYKPFSVRFVAEEAERRKNVSQADLSYPPPTLMQYERSYEETPDSFRPNRDIPQTAASLDWGHNDPNYLTLFGSDMDNRDFSERCYNPPNSDRLYRLEMRNSDQKPWHLQIERIMGWMACDYQTAYAFSDCFEKLDLTRESVIKLMHGKKSIAGTGIKHLPYFMALIDDTEIPDSPEDVMNFISKSGDDVEAIGAVFQKLHRYGYEAVEEEFELTEDFLYQNEKESVSFNSSAFTAKELGRDELSLDDDLINEIRTAKWDDLKTISKRMFASYVENEYGGYWKSAEYQHKLPSWISDFWSRIKARKAEIIRLAFKYHVNPEIKQNFKLMRQIPSPKQRWFLAQTMVKGGTFTFKQTKVKFGQCKPHERVVIEHALSMANKM
jgi:hypothetical protein